MELLAKASGCYLYKDGSTIQVKAAPSGWIATARFVLLLLTIVPLGAGTSQIVRAIRGHDDFLVPGVILVSVAAIFGLALWRLSSYARKKQSDQLITCVLDLRDRKLLDPAGNVLADLHDVKVAREFQMTSSAKKLVMRWPGGSYMLAKGNPFAGGTQPLENVFREHGLM